MINEDCKFLSLKFFLDSKLKSEYEKLNPPPKKFVNKNDKNVKSDRDLQKLHSTVKKKEINIISNKEKLGKLDSLSVSSVKITKPLKKIDISKNPNNRDSQSVKAPEKRSKLKKDIKDSHLQTETSQQVDKKNLKKDLSPSKSLNKSPFLGENNTDKEKHKKSNSDFKKNIITKDLGKKPVENVEKDKKKIIAHEAIIPAKNGNNKAKITNDKSKNAKNSEVKNEKNGVKNVGKNNKNVEIEKKKEEEKNVESVLNAISKTEIVNENAEKGEEKLNTIVAEVIKEDIKVNDNETKIKENDVIVNEEKANLKENITAEKKESNVVEHKEKEKEEIAKNEQEIKV